jgi:UDP-glucose 4-epimerase
MKKTILVTGANGFVGGEVVQKLQKDTEHNIVTLDIKDLRYPKTPNTKEYICDITKSQAVEKLFIENDITDVIHLAAIIPGTIDNEEFIYKVDVQGTKTILKLCIKYGVKRFINTSSGAAYGYYSDNPTWITESDTIRGNEEFSYSKNKRICEEMFKEFHTHHPELTQIIFRPGTILGKTVSNQITNLFQMKFVLGMEDGDDRFNFIWDDDIAKILIKALDHNETCAINIAGDGALSMKEIAAILGKKYINVNPKFATFVISALNKLKLTKLKPEQVNFLRYRPVLSNKKLKEDFGFTPQYTSRQAFDQFLIQNPKQAQSLN